MCSVPRDGLVVGGHQSPATRVHLRVEVRRVGVEGEPVADGLTGRVLLHRRLRGRLEFVPRLRDRLADLLQDVLVHVHHRERLRERPRQQLVPILRKRVRVVVALVDVVLRLLAEAVLRAVLIRGEIDDDVGFHVIGDEALVRVRELRQGARLDRAKRLLVELGVVALVERGDGDALPVGVVELLHHRVEGDLLRTREGVPERDVHRARERDVCLGRLLRRRSCRATRRGDDEQQRRQDPCL